MLAGLFLMALVLQKASAAFPTFGARLGFVVLAGAIGIPISDFGPPVWYQLPWSLWIANGIFHLTAWVLVGIVLAKLVSAPPAKA